MTDYFSCLLFSFKVSLLLTNHYYDNMPSFKIPLFPLSFTHCLATHLSASDSFSTMALYKSIYLLTYNNILVTI